MTSDERRMLMDQLVQHEGIRLKPYVDTVGKITIGVGRNLTDVGLSSAEAMSLLEHDVEMTLHDCETLDWYHGLSPVRQRVIADLRFNLGLVGLQQFQQMIAAVKRQDFDEAARQLLDSRYATQVGQRATDLAQMLRTNVDPHEVIYDQLPTP